MSTDLVPNGLPELRKGRHESPSDGACLMEYVSVLAGEPFTDRPACVDPLLVRLSWAINDISSDAIRGQLPDLAPRLIGTASGGPLVAPLLVIACCSAARVRLGPGADRVFAPALARAHRRLHRVESRMKDGRRVRGARAYQIGAETALNSVVRELAALDERHLPHLLRTAVDVAVNTRATASTGSQSVVPTTGR